MMKKAGYALVNVLIVMALVTSYEIYRYEQCRQERRMYTDLQNKLLCDVMSNMAGNSHEKIKFNTGTVDFNAPKAPIKLNNGFSTTDWHKVT